MLTLLVLHVSLGARQEGRKDEVVTWWWLGGDGGGLAVVVQAVVPVSILCSLCLSKKQDLKLNPSITIRFSTILDRWMENTNIGKSFVISVSSVNAKCVVP